MAKILVTGGCGYIGAHTVVDLIENGFEVVSIDNYSRSNHTALKGIKAITGKEVINHAIDLCDYTTVKRLFEQEGPFEGIIHFAAYKTVPESMAKPLMYYRNNLESLVNLLDCVQEFKTPYFIFSSSCSVYGNSKEQPVTENTPFERAESPYGRTKQMGEEIIRDLTAVNSNTAFIMLRYFNPAGAHPTAKIGELPIGTPNNLVPYITQTAMGLRDKLRVFGNDYPTPDGTCVRDYIHVMDVADAHTKALQHLINNKQTQNPEVFNLGIGKGISVLEVIQAFETANNLKLNYEIAPRRAGDVATIYANNDKAASQLGWRPKYSLEDMMRSAWKWEQGLAGKATL